MEYKNGIQKHSLPPVSFLIQSVLCQPYQAQIIPLANTAQYNISITISILQYNLSTISEWITMYVLHNSHLRLYGSWCGDVQIGQHPTNKIYKGL